MASFRKRGNSWQYRIKHNGEEISKSGFRTKAEAKVAANKVEHELNIGVNITASDQLFTDYFKQWFDTYKKGQFSEDNDRTYQHAMALAEEYFADKRLKDIDHKAYQSFLNDYAKERAKSTVDKVNDKVGAPLRHAFNHGHIQHNPTYKVNIGGDEAADESDKYLNKHEAEKVLGELLNNIRVDYLTRYMLILQLATGARIGEIMALQFGDLNFLNNRIDISKTWDYKYTQDFKPTKNREVRNISVDAQTMKIIKAVYDDQRAKKVQDRKQRLFAKDGKVPGVNAVNKALKRACKRAGVKEVTSHALRHTHASLLILNGVSMAYISKRLGHQSITITEGVYSHVVEELEVKNEKESADMFYDIYN